MKDWIVEVLDELNEALTEILDAVFVEYFPITLTVAFFAVVVALAAILWRSA